MSLMCIQVLPIKEVGKLLFNNQIVEEHVDGSSSKGTKLSYNDINCHRHSDYSSEMNPDLFRITVSSGYHEDIPASPIQEIQTPPPNNHLG